MFSISNCVGIMPKYGLGMIHGCFGMLKSCLYFKIYFRFSDNSEGGVGLVSFLTFHLFFRGSGNSEGGVGLVWLF